MNLKQRIDTLQGQRGRATPPASAEVSDLTARIRRMQASGRQRRRPPAISEAELARRLRAELAAPGLIRIERRLPLTKVHGKAQLGALTQGLEGLPAAQGLDPQRLVFLDTETTGLAGGAGTTVFLLGLARLEGRHLVVRQYLLSRFEGEAAMLEQAARWIGEDSVLVTYNGKRFDIPLLTTRALLAGRTEPFSTRQHLDLLYPVRRAFASRWADCRLATAETNLLGFRRQNDLPGSEAPAAWQDWMRHNDPSRLPAIGLHNLWDLLSLVGLLPALAATFQSPLRTGGDPLGVAKSWLDAGQETRALGVLRANCVNLKPEGQLLLGQMLARAGDWRHALPLLRRLAEQGNAAAKERLAKYYEHVARDFGQALDLARALPAEMDPPRRVQRLRRKLAAPPAGAG